MDRVSTRTYLGYYQKYFIKYGSLGLILLEAYGERLGAQRPTLLLTLLLPLPLPLTLLRVH
jgi:hypothetical protein